MVLCGKAVNDFISIDKDIDKHLDKVKRLHKEHVAASQRKICCNDRGFSTHLDMNNEHTLLDRGAIWTLSDKQKAEYADDDDGSSL